MVKAELNKRTPLRVFENSINGGVGKGNIGVIASKKGVGKTACLVHIATDKLFRDRHVIHVSFSQRVDHIINWYEDIFKEIAKKRELENAVEIHDGIIKNRVIMNFNREGTTTEQVLSSVRAMIEGGNFSADSIIFDGYDISSLSNDDIVKIKNFAKELNLEIWFSSSLKGTDPVFLDNGVPEDIADKIDLMDVLVTLKFEGDFVRLQVVKDHDNLETRDLNLRLEPKTMLIARD